MRTPMAMKTVLQGPRGRHGTMGFPVIRNALNVFAVGIFVAVSAEVGTSENDLRARLEKMVRGSPITESTTTFHVDTEPNEGPPAEPFSKMGPADRFRLIVQAEAEEGEDLNVQIEPAKVLHPINKPKLGHHSSRRSDMAKVVVGVLPSAMLFPQVIFGSRMKKTVLEDEAEMQSYFVEANGSGDTPFLDIPESTENRVMASLTSNTAVTITAAAAAIGAMYLSMQAWKNWRERRGIGMLAPTTAKWDLQQCLLIIDIHGAQKAGAILGKYVPTSASVQVNVNTQHATLTYSRIPTFRSSPLKSLMRKAETVQEHFNLPADHCFVSAAGASGKQKDEGTPRSFIQEYMEKKAFGGKRVAALVLHAEKSPGLQVVQQSAAPPAPPPVDLLDAIRFKHQTSGENLVELEEAPTVSGKDAALESLNDLVAGSSICGGTVLCVDSVSISTNKSLCTVHAAVEDMRPISVFADVSLQTLSIVVEGDGNGASDDGASQAPTVTYQIALPRNCVLGDASRASYTVAPFSMDVEPAFGGSTGSGKSPLDGLTEEAGGESVTEAPAGPLDGLTEEAEGEVVTMATAIATADENGPNEGERDLNVADQLEMESDMFTVDSSEQEGVNSDDAKIDTNCNSSTADYQHVRVQFRPLPKSEVTVSLSLLPEKQLPS